MCRDGNPFAVAYRDEKDRKGAQRAHDLVDALEELQSLMPETDAGSADHDAPEKSNLSEQQTGNEYPHNWHEIAAQIKGSRGWRCEVCSFQLVNSGTIQVHHIDGDKTDNGASNLQVLCAVCHGEHHSRSPLLPIGIDASELEALMKHHRAPRHSPRP